MVYFVTKDIERAIGIDLKHYADISIITNESPLAIRIQKLFSDNIILNNGNYLSTFDLLLEHKNLLTKHDRIVVFKNSSQIERLCNEYEWELLNPSSTLVNRFERKITQYEWIVTIGDVPIIPTHIGTLDSFSYTALADSLGETFILQYSVGHTGNGTMLIKNESDLTKLQESFPERLVKVSKFMECTVYTANVSVEADYVRVGNISKQLTGIECLTDNPFATVGNDWEATKQELLENQITNITQLAQYIGNAMRNYGWKGLYGIDVIVEKKSGNIFFLEINARQPQSAGYETILAHKQKANGPMDWHLHTLAKTNLPFESNNYEITAKQVFPRITECVSKEYQIIIDKRNADIEAFYK